MDIEDHNQCVADFVEVSSAFGVNQDNAISGFSPILALLGPSEANSFPSQSMSCCRRSKFRKIGNTESRHARKLQSAQTWPICWIRVWNVFSLSKKLVIEPLIATDSDSTSNMPWRIKGWHFLNNVAVTRNADSICHWSVATGGWAFSLKNARETVKSLPFWFDPPC